MMKPAAMVQFERLYWASFVLTMIAKAMTWSTQADLARANPVLADRPWIVPLTTAIGVAIVALLWFFTCRRPSIVAKWIVVVFAAIGGIGILLSLFMFATGRIAEVAPGIVSILANIVYVAAAVMLFKPQAKEWFGEEPDDADATIA